MSEYNAEAGSIDAVAAAAVAEPRDLSAHAAPDGTVTILFSDVENSSAIFERLGDLRAQEILSAHNAIVREQTALQNGFEVKSMGDGFMIAFSSARRALLCAINIQKMLAAYSEQNKEEPIRVRIGMHVGEVIRESADFFGKAVILAARIAARAHGGEILVSSTLRDLTETAGDLRFAGAGDAQLKGFSGTTAFTKSFGSSMVLPEVCRWNHAGCRATRSKLNLAACRLHLAAPSEFCLCGDKIRCHDETVREPMIVPPSVRLML